MKILLGTAGSETEITDEDRTVSFDTEDIKKIVYGENGTAHEYYIATKQLVSISYSFISNTNLAAILAEYNKHTSLSLKIETAIRDVYDTYTVIITSTFPRELFNDLDAGRNFTNLTINLREK